MAETRERPILFTGPMVRAILDGSKTQTRRVINRIATIGRVTEFGPSDTPGYDFHARDRRMLWNDLRAADLLRRCPYGVPGDLLYVRETWAQPFAGDTRASVIYRADGPEYLALAKRARNWGSEATWKPSIHMPKRYSRLWLRITDVRVERVQEISEDDCIAEGCAGVPCLHTGPSAGMPGCTDCMNSGWQEPPGVEFRDLWDSINAKRGYGWDVNPWVWVVEFERVPRPEGEGER